MGSTQRCKLKKVSIHTIFVVWTYVVEVLILFVTIMLSLSPFQTEEGYSCSYLPAPILKSSVSRFTKFLIRFTLSDFHPLKIPPTFDRMCWTDDRNKLRVLCFKRLIAHHFILFQGFRSWSEYCSIQIRKFACLR